MVNQEREPLTYDSDRLIREWRDRYTDRRTIARQLLDDAEVLVRDAIARELEQQRREAKTERERELERREREVERAEAWNQQRIDRLTAQLAEAKAKVEGLSSRRTLMREERETVDQGTVVRLLAPTEPMEWTKDKSQVRPWMLGELEDVTHRLRMAGGEDGTEVRFKRDAIEACVPFAEFALSPARRPEPRLPDPGRPAERAVTPPVRILLAVAALVLVVSVVVGLVAPW